MNRLVPPLLAALALLASTATQAGPLRFTFYDCGAAADCSQGSRVMTRFDTPGEVIAPAVPPAGSLSALADVSVTQILDGGFDDLDIYSFNLNGFIGSTFRFTGLDGADGFAYGPLVAVAAFSADALRLVWDAGVYKDLGLVTCLTATCSVTTTLRANVRLVVDDVPAQGVPEPSSLALGLLALAAAGAAARRQAA